MKKNVLIVHNYYQIAGGEDEVVANESKLLRDNGHKVILYTRHNSELNSMSLFQKLKLPFTTIYNPRTFKEIKNIIKNEKIDIVHVHNTLNLVSASVYYAAYKCGVPVVQTIHNYRLLCPKATFYRNGSLCEDCIKQGLNCAVRHKCYRDSLVQTLICVIATKYHRFRGIYAKINYICLTSFGRSKILSINKNHKNNVINPDNVFVKPNFMQDVSGAVLDSSQRKAMLVYAGRLDESKGVDKLLIAWKEIDKEIKKNKQKTALGETRLIVCGEGPMSAWCHDFVRDNELNNVILKGKIDHSEVLELFKEAMATVIPTQWYEGFPMSIAESYSVGTPVIGPDMGNVGSIVIDGVTGIKYNPDESDGLRRAIERLLVCDNKDSLYKGAYQEFKEKYTQDLNYRELVEIYSTVIDRNKRK